MEGILVNNGVPTHSYLHLCTTIVCCTRYTMPTNRIISCTNNNYLNL